MPYDPYRHHRRSIRLKGYDYTRSGAYFITSCVKDRMCLFGSVRDGRMRLNVLGEIVWDVWNGLPRHYPHVRLDAFIVMPNHIHGIIRLVDDVGSGDDSGGGRRGDDGRNAAVGAGLKPAPTTTASSPPSRAKRHGLPEIVRALKTFSARRINNHRGTTGTSVWQRNYYEHIIRDERDYRRIAAYIKNNPRRWADDRLRPGSPNPYPIGR